MSPLYKKNMKTFDIIIKKKSMFFMFKQDLTCLYKNNLFLSFNPVPRLKLWDSWGSRENLSIRQMFEIRHILKIDNFKIINVYN